MTRALREVGVEDDTLTVEEKSKLDHDGFVPLRGVLELGQVAALNRRLAELVAEEADAAGREVHQEAGTDRLADLVNKDPMFAVCFSHPRVLAAVRHVLGEFKLSSLNSRAAHPGQGHQPFHADSGRPATGDGYQVCNSIWLLDDFTTDNGATRVVPGSHRSGQLPKDGMDDPADPHPDEVQVVASAGTVVVFNAHLWHGGTRNRGTAARRAMHGFFCRRELPAQTDQQAYLQVATYERLSPAQRFVLAVRPPT